MLAAFWSFTNRVNRIHPSLLNICHDICLPCQQRLEAFDPTGPGWVGVRCGHPDYHHAASGCEGDPIERLLTKSEYVSHREGTLFNALPCLFFTTISHHFFSHPRHMALNSVLDPSELKVHLDLLRAFHDMKSKVENESKPEFNAHTLSPEERWKSFVQASVERCVVCECTSRGTITFCCFRFYEWVSGLKVDGNDITERMECPPLDVCLVWHAYSLNPRWVSATLRTRATGLMPVVAATPEISNSSRL